MSDENVPHDEAGPAMVVKALQETALLACVRLKALGISRTDRSAGKELADRKNAVTGSSKVLVNRLSGADEHHKAIMSAHTLARAALHKRSMPYGADDGWRILPNSQFEPMLRDYAIARKQFEDAHALMMGDAQAIIAAAKANMGDFDVDVPDEQELREAYSMKVEFRPVPAGFKSKTLPEATVAKLAKHADANLASAFDVAVRDTFHRLMEPLSAFVVRMDAYQAREEALENGEDPGRNGLFRDSIVENVLALKDMVGMFNLAGDDRMVQLRRALEDFAADVTADALRVDQALRGTAKAKALLMIQTLREWCA